MNGRLLACTLYLFLLLAPASAAQQAPAVDPASFLRAWFAEAEAGMDYGRAKLAIDKYVEPSFDTEAALAEIDAMVATVKRMLSTIPAEAAATDLEKLRAIQTFLYQPGWWNDQKPFAYDTTVPNGQAVSLQLLPNYLATRRGNCVSMPILMLILGERLGLDITLSTAPLHIFVKWTDRADGRTYNFEATAGRTARDSLFRHDPALTDMAVKNGVYLKKLSRREALAVIASTALDHLYVAGRHEEAIAAADTILAAYPAHAYALAHKAAAYHGLLGERVFKTSPEPADIPAALIPYANALYLARQEALERAAALGWRKPALNLSIPRATEEE